MTDMDTLCQNLEAIWHEQIPLSKAMTMKIAHFRDHVLTTHAGLAPNVNVHGTAFAGSLYAIQALTGWGMMHLQLKLNDLNASIVIANGQIDYARPVAEDIHVTCGFGEHLEEFEKLFANQNAAGRRHRGWWIFRALCRAAESLTQIHCNAQADCN